MKRMATALLLLVVLSGCESKAPPAETASVSADAHYDNSIDMKHLMEWILDPSADVIWGAVGSITTEAGEQVLAPQTDEEWTAIRNAAAVVAESGNLLLLPERARDQDDWAKHSRALTKAAQAALAAAEAKDTESLFTAGGDIYIVCSECHSQYALEIKKVE